MGISYETQSIVGLYKTFKYPLSEDVSNRPVDRKSFVSEPFTSNVREVYFKRQSI